MNSQWAVLMASAFFQPVQIRQKHEAPEDFLDDCGHPRHAPLHLKVTPMSGCDGFEAATPL